MKKFLLTLHSFSKAGLLFIAAFLFISTKSHALNITIIESETYNPAQKMDVIWQGICQSMGYTATIYSKTELNQLSNLSSTDILIIASGVDTVFTGTRLQVVKQYLQNGGKVYLQTEYLSSFNPNMAYQALVDSLGGSFTWTGTVSGDLAPMKILGTLSTDSLPVSRLTYFWYGQSIAPCSTVETFLECSGNYFGCIFCVPTSTGRLITTSDQDWINQSTSDSLMENIITNLAQTSYTCASSGGIYFVVNNGRDTTTGCGNTIVLTTAGNSGAFQWQSSTDNVSFNNINGANSLTYGAKGLTQNTYYRISASGSCGQYYSPSIKVTVGSSSVLAGTVTSSRDSICNRLGLVSVLNTSGSSGSLQWQSSTDGIHFTNLPNDTGTGYTTPPTLSQTTYYRVVATGPCGSTDSSNVKPVHIIPEPVAQFNFTINGWQVTFNSDSSSNDVTAYSWNFGDSSALNTQPNPTHTFSKTDTFNVCLTVYNGSNCSYTICQYVVLLGSSGAGVNNIPAPSVIQLYPNPANNTINLLVNGIEGNYQIKIYNVLGQLVRGISAGMSDGHESPLQDKQIIPIPLDNLAEGTYQLILSNGNGIYGKRFVHVK